MKEHSFEIEQIIVKLLTKLIALCHIVFGTKILEIETLCI